MCLPKPLNETELIRLTAWSAASPVGVLCGQKKMATPAPINRLRAQIGFQRQNLPGIMAFADDPDACHEAAVAVFSMFKRGISVRPGKTYALAEAATAITDIESGKGTGATLLAISD